jgi:hypothetical protein
MSGFKAYTPITDVEELQTIVARLDRELREERWVNESQAATRNKEMSKMKAIVVTTEFRGVFFGYVEDESTLPESVTLKDARNCVYWSSSVKGVLGLAAGGPNKDCRVGSKVPSLTVWKITGVAECSDVAVKAWESEPWN